MRTSQYFLASKMVLEVLTEPSDFSEKVVADSRLQTRSYRAGRIYQLSLFCYFRVRVAA